MKAALSMTNLINYSSPRKKTVHAIEQVTSVGFSIEF